MKTLGELFDISSGLVSKRKEAPPNVSGIKYRILTLRSINEKGFIDKKGIDNFTSVEEIDEKYLGRVGDVVIRLSYPFTAAIIDEETEGVIITSLFAILRSKTNKINSEYISIYLNSEGMKKQYMKDASGSALQMIKTSSLKDYSVKTPDISKQEKIINMNRLFIKESILLEDLIENKKIYGRIILHKLMEE